MSPLRPRASVIASLLVGVNSATSINGSSAGLRTREDRERFLALRNSPEIGAILVGRRSADLEPYRTAPHPLFIYSHEVKDSLPEFIERISDQIQGVILCEGGVTLLHQLLRLDLIDTLFLSRVEREGDNHFLDEALLVNTLSPHNQERVGTTTFQRYERASR